MRAAVFQGAGKPLAIEEVADPTPGDGELLVRVKDCGICGSDLHAAEMPGALPPGTVMGHEFAGEVVEVGREARGEWKPGERVCALPYIACGRCRACLNGDGMRCERIRATGLGQLPGAYAEAVLVGAHEALRLPAPVGFREGATVEPLAVGLHAVHESRLQAGERVLVIGAGPIGLVTARWARFFGARDVVVSERAESRRALAAAFGATAVIDPGPEPLGVAFEKAAGGPPDVIFECVGVPGLLQECILTAPVRGRIVVVGVCMQPDTIMPGLAILKEVALKFVVGYLKQDFAFTLEMLDAERIDPQPMITSTVGLDRLPEAFEALRTTKTECKVLLEP
jgi:(R,R)-butanediol dehydrogenase/meso-butanediol dehydrogenase/diacetyl reductase